jgi:hypothetical protein
MEYGQLGGLNYRMSFPGQQQQPAQQIQSVDSQGYLPQQPKNLLAVRENLTNDYYNNYALLQDIVKDATTKGINPFEPDYSQDGGGLAFQTFQRAQANLMYSANALANEYEKEKQIEEARMRGDIRLASEFDPKSQMYTENPDAYYSTKPLPFVNQANQRLNTPTYTRGDEQRFNQAYMNPNIQQIDQMVASGQLSPEEGEFQKANLQKNVAQTSYQQLIPRNGRGGSFNTPEIEILKKVTNLSQGIWPEGTFSVTTKNGNPVLENKTYAGEYLGDYQGVDAKGNPKIYRKIVKRWIKNPDTGEVTIEFDNSDIPSEKVSGTRGDVVASALITNNPKYGSASKMYETARELGYLDDTSSAINERLISEDAGKINQNIANKVAASTGKVKEELQSVVNKLESLENPVFGWGYTTFKLPNGNEVKIGKHKVGDGYFIDNPEKLVTDEAPNGYDSDIDHRSLEDIISWLEKASYFKQFLGEPATKVNQGGKKAY